MALIDKDDFPRDKVCGEFLSWDATPLTDAIGLTSLLDGHGCPRITTCRVVGSRGASEFTFPFPARGVSRMLLDDSLVRRAAVAGATLFNRHAVSGVAEAPAGGWTISLTLRDDAGSTRIHAGSVIGAWGRWGRIDRDLHRAFVSAPRRRHFGFKRHAIAESYPRGSEVIELHPFHRGYLGVSSIEGGRTNLCGLVDESRIRTLKGGWPTFIEALREERAPLARLWSEHSEAGDFLSSDPVIFGGKEPSMGSMIFVGDASGMIDPLTGNGMTMAMQSGALAFCTIAESGGNDWDHQWREFFRRRIAWSRVAATLLTRPRLIDVGISTRIAASLGAFLSARTRASHDEASRLADRVASHLPA